MPDADLAALLGSLSADDRRRGLQFEEICRWYLLNDPVYRGQLKAVWLWRDWPGRWGQDAGIDLVAEAHDGRLWAVQAKAYHPDYSIKKADIDSFLSESARPEFSYRLLIATTDRVARLAEQAMTAQEKPVGQILLHELERAEAVWPSSIADLRPAIPQPKQPLPHQEEALEATLTGFAESDRGQLIMACGTGKTLVSLWISENLEAQRTLVLVPSLSLLKQTIREWLINRSREFEFLPVCSDDTVREPDPMIASVVELGFPATGVAEEVAAFLKRPGPRVVFSTYQSSPVIAAAMEAGGPQFDLAIADEAHRCAGPVSSDFATILAGDQIRAAKRLFMTATPRLFTGRIRKAGIEADFEIASMDDDEQFGEVLHRLTFGEAIERDLLSDYRVLVIGVDHETYRSYAETGRLVTLDGKHVADAGLVAAQIGVAKAMRNYDLRRTLAFLGRVEAAKEFAASLSEVIAWIPADERPDGEIWADHVSGRMSSGQREARLRRLRELGEAERGLLANARCLAEGVDVPTLDGVAFIDPKRSEVDIAQAVGRVIRKTQDKSLGTVVIPVLVPAGENPEAKLETSAFKWIWDVIRALRDHDEGVATQLDALRRAMGGRSAPRVGLPAKIVVDMPARVSEEFARAFATLLVRQSTAAWQEWYGLLQTYAQREEHARVPSAQVEGGLLLGNWVAHQRVAYRKGKLDSERVRQLEALPDWSWDTRAGAWEEGFAQLRRFATRERSARVPKRHVEGEFRLGNWVSAQRVAYRKGRLDPESIARLEALPGWNWRLKDPGLRKRILSPETSWEEGFAELVHFSEREGHARVSKAHVEHGSRLRKGKFRLGNWVHAQRVAYRKGKLDSERVKRLEWLPGWEWEWPRRGR